MSRSLRSAVLALACVCVNAHMAYWAPPENLQPVQGLYVKPSVDGTTGDLYVAATEDNGVNSQWVVEQPINFLQPQAGYPLAYASSPHDEVITTQKRAVISNPPMPYNYLKPGAPVDGNSAVIPYSYAAVPSANTPSTAEGTAAQYPEGYPTNYPYAGSYPYSLLQYFYPYLMSMSAAANAASAKDLGLSEDVAKAVTSPTASAIWSPAASYAYPWQYMMMGPNAWTQSTAAPAAAPASSAPTTQTSSETTLEA